jgi:hypothetical protein
MRFNALTRERFDWKPLSRKSPAFRGSLDVDKIGNANVGSGNAGPFDLALANELYPTVQGPVEQLVKDQRGLQVVPSGALTALPFHPAVWSPFALSGEGAARQVGVCTAASALRRLINLQNLHSCGVSDGDGFSRNVPTRSALQRV